MLVGGTPAIRPPHGQALPPAPAATALEGLDHEIQFLIASRPRHPRSRGGLGDARV